MKEIACRFNKNKFNSNKSSYYDFNVVYNEQKKILPWLKKESLRWHVRASAADKKKKETATTNDSLIRKKEEEFWKKVKKCCCEYTKKKEDYEKVIDELEKKTNTQQFTD